MKVTYPLSLKVSLWLLLNLLLLGAVALGFFVVQGGLDWSALLSGRTGNRAQAKANAIATEVAAAAIEERTAILERFSADYGVPFVLVRTDDVRLAGPALEFPEAVRSRIEAMRGFGRGPFGREFGNPGGRGARGGTAGPDELRGTAGEKSPRREPPPNELDRKETPPEIRRPVPLEPGRERELGRFIERAGSPASFWLALRVPFAGPDRGRFQPAVLVARIDSFWGLLRFLELESWVLASAVVLGLSVLFWLPLVRDITRHVGRLTHATEQIAEGRFDTRVASQRRDELGKLGESVNRMAARLDAHMTGQKRFLGDVAHELCSPLARLQMATGILAEQAPKNLQPTVEDLRDEVQQMSTLVNELLAFTRAGLRPREVVLAPVEVAALAREVLAREDAHPRATLTAAEELRVMADRDLLARALGNLVRNALRYSGEATPVVVHARRQNGKITITVDDEGPGVPADALDRLGEPFFRPEEARTRETGGVGLGLAIVRSSIAACGGDVRFSNRAPRGFRAEVSLPVA